LTSDAVNKAQIFTHELAHTLAFPVVLSGSADRYLSVHNIGAGTRIEDVLLTWTIKGHYRFF